LCKTTPASFTTITMSSQNEDANPGYETTDVKPGAVWLVAAGLVVTVALVFVAITWLFHALQRRDLASQQRSGIDRVTNAVAATRPQFPEPRLQVAPQADLAALRAREDVALKTYGWVDRNAGVVRIPIERAMDLIAQRGLPVRGQPNAPKPTRTTLDMQQARPLQIAPSEAPK
jgi:hypothetical protein